MADWGFKPEETVRLKEAGVTMIVLFGSRAQGIAGDGGDFDFLVFGHSDKKAYDAVYDILAAKIDQLVDIDIVFEDAAPMELQQHVSKYGQVIFGENRKDFADFRQRVMINYSDFAYYRHMFQQATLARI